MQALYLLIFISGLAALPWLGMKMGGRPVIAAIALLEAIAVGWLAGSIRTVDIASCGGDDLCISEMIGWSDRVGVLFVLFLFAVIGASTYLAYALKGKMREIA
ncbi:hypothetical protein [Taklimakanibacter lacteus]|uniref:hypothetical protein n=1 Tax=Taklimakanibacter lacteus TaxID=2268456 RepID=UPI000E66F37D